MAQVTKSFTATGNSLVLLVKYKETFTYSLSGTWVGTVVLERSVDNGATWRTERTDTANAVVTIFAEDSGANKAQYRMRCSAFTSGTIVASLVDELSDKLSNYTLQAFDAGRTVGFDCTSAARTAALPDLSKSLGKTFTVMKTDSSTNALTISGTINGAANTTCNTQYEAVELYASPAGWVIKHRTINEAWQTFTPTGSWVANAAYTGKYRRVGDSLEMRVTVDCSGAPTAADLYITLPNSWAIDTDKISSAAPGTSLPLMGVAVCRDANSGSGSVIGGLYYRNTTTIQVTYFDDAAAGIAMQAAVNATSPFTFDSSDFVEIHVTGLPISGWKG